MFKKIRIMVMLTIAAFSLNGIARADETALFTTSVAPDALIVLDLSGSMNWNPAGGSNIYGNASCSGTFYSSSGSGHTTNCSRLAIAKRAIFDILDDNGSGSVSNADETSLGVRLGYMRFYNCSGDDTGNSTSSGCNTLRRAIGSSYSNINSSVSGESSTGGTTLVSALREAKIYLDAHKASDNAGACRQKFVILVTDGADTFGCDGNGTETQSTMYKRRRETVAKAKALADEGYRLFVIGFGAAMPDYLERNLNWTAYFGGTDNPLTANADDTGGYNPDAVTACQVSSTTGTCNGTSTNCFATANDPGNAALSGYAFLAADGDQLAQQLKTAINIVREATYSFSQSSIQSSRTMDENFIYEGSFQPITGDPFWLGHLKKYSVNGDGTVGDELWDAGEVLKAASASGRNIKTYKAGALINFTTANLTNADLAVASNADRDAVIGYFRGESSYNPENWKLGDVFRSTPITVGTPSIYFGDMRDTGSNPNAFYQHRLNHIRSSDPYSGRVILAGANDGQMHAFRTSDGSEAWSFIPPNLLPRLKLIVHSSEPTSLTHQYYVDGPVTVADAWVPASPGDGRSKSADDWRTILMFGEGRGGGTNLWSASPSCDSSFNQSYNPTFKYYCGYYCMDVTDSLNPTLEWMLGLSASSAWESSRAPYMGAPWSKPMIGRVLDGGYEKWVAFIGGGVASPGGADSGKGFFIVDLRDGSILWSYTKANDVDMNSPMPAPPAIVDTDNDGFIDWVYMGDLGSNMWRFRLCRAADGDSCTTVNWSGSRLFQANSSSGNRPIYTSAAVAKDQYQKIWVYWGTGDKTDPTSASAQEKFYALRDEGRSSPRTISDLENITNAAGYADGSKDGYYINMTGHGEKILSEPIVFGGLVYFTTFTPASGNDPCAQGGTATLYALRYRTGAGALPVAGTPRSMTIGSGIPSAPVISLKPVTAGAVYAAVYAAAVAAGASAGAASAAASAAAATVSAGGTTSAAAAAASAAATAAGASASAAAAAAAAASAAISGGSTPDLYVTTSGGGGIGSQTQRVNINPPGLANRTNLIYWRNTRLQ